MQLKDHPEPQKMNARPDLSIIIPSYNCADLVELAVESAYAFTNRPLEVIVVDDGSTDRSQEVFAALTRRFPELKVIHQVNGGLSHARNTGIRHAKGQYIVLLDADDQLVPVGQLNILDEGPDMVRMGIEEVDIDGSILLHVERWGKSTGLDYLATRFKEQNFYTPSWAYMYKLDWLRLNELRFVNRLIHEDMLFTVEALLHCRSLVATDSLGYRYYRRAGSITKTKDEVYIQKRISSLSKICMQLTPYTNAYPSVDLGWWILSIIEYAASLAGQTRSRSARWAVLRMELRFFVFNKVWEPFRTRKNTRFRLRKRLGDWATIALAPES